MYEYTFRYGPFCFKVIGEGDKDAVNKARRAIEESFPEDSLDHLRVDLTAGAFEGRLYVETREISVKDIARRHELIEETEAVPF